MESLSLSTSESLSPQDRINYIKSEIHPHNPNCVLLEADSLSGAGSCLIAEKCNELRGKVTQLFAVDAGVTSIPESINTKNPTAVYILAPELFPKRELKDLGFSKDGVLIAPPEYVGPVIDYLLKLAA